MTPPTSQQRRALKARSHHLEPVVMIGDAGLSPEVAREVDLALSSHELIKVRVLGDDRVARVQLAAEICTRHDAALIGHIGKMLVLFRARPPESEKAAKPRRRAGPRRTKKQLGARAERP